MPTITDEAVCIRHWDYSETSQTVSLFSREHGVIRGLAKGSKRQKGRFSGGIDLLTRGEVVAIIRPSRELATLTEWDLTESYWPLRHQLDAHRAGLYFADLVFHMVTDHDPHPTLFDSLTEALARLGGRTTRDEVVVRFLWALLREAGYQPEVGEGAVARGATHVFDANASQVLPADGNAQGWRVRAGTVAVLRGLKEPGALVTFEPGFVPRAARLLSAYVRHLLGKELPTMRLVYPDLSETAS